MGYACWIASVTYDFASAIASAVSMPFARPAAIAEAKVQPVPCVLVVFTRIDVNSR